MCLEDNFKEILTKTSLAALFYVSKVVRGRGGLENVRWWRSDAIPRMLGTFQIEPISDNEERKDSM